MDLHHNNLQTKFDYCDLDLILKVIADVFLFLIWFPLNISINNWPNLTKFAMELHPDNFQAKFDYRDLDLIFKVIATILFVVDMVSAQYLKK